MLAVAAFSQLIFDSVNASNEIEVPDLNADVELMVQKLSEKMSDKSSGEYLKEDAERALDPYWRMLRAKLRLRGEWTWNRVILRG